MIRTSIVGRTGIQTYAEDELVDGGLPYRMVTANRPLKAVRDSIPYMKGIPMSMSHDDYKDSVVGHVLDAWVDGTHIYAVMSIKDEISPKGFSIGYDAHILKSDDITADYEFNIIIPTHIAIVDNPRCGEVCRYD